MHRNQKFINHSSRKRGNKGVLFSENDGNGLLKDSMLSDPWKPLIQRLVSEGKLSSKELQVDFSPVGQV